MTNNIIQKVFLSPPAEDSQFKPGETVVNEEDRVPQQDGGKRMLEENREGDSPVLVDQELKEEEAKPHTLPSFVQPSTISNQPAGDQNSNSNLAQLSAKSNPPAGDQNSNSNFVLVSKKSDPPVGAPKPISNPVPIDVTKQQSVNQQGNVPPQVHKVQEVGGAGRVQEVGGAAPAGKVQEVGGAGRVQEVGGAAPGGAAAKAVAVNPLPSAPETENPLYRQLSPAQVQEAISTGQMVCE